MCTRYIAVPPARLKTLAILPTDLPGLRRRDFSRSAGGGGEEEPTLIEGKNQS
ncbi:hypothetical protein BVC80_8831g11 [Macleaya cordata]|uniref:Uncharacterized protein n=1 Tax=Macleaya cordata TaxID=56857 RepID=A0A200RE19_MACCD|nr:hypothetical protein BVC80_8831g11 [Macleaya cordata]